MSSESPCIEKRKLSSQKERMLILSTKERRHYDSLMSQCNEWVFIKENSYKIRKLLNKIKLKTGLTPGVQRQVPKVSSPCGFLTGIQYRNNGNKLDRLMSQTTHVSEKPRERRQSQQITQDQKDLLLVQKSALSPPDPEIYRKKKIHDCYCLNAEYLEKIKKLQKKAKKNPPPQPEPTRVKKKSIIKNIYLTQNYTRKPIPKKVDSISIKEAMRDREWLSSAKDQIVRDIINYVNNSNGQIFIRPEENYFTYKYFLGCGNNAPLVRQVMATRPWWMRVGKEERHTANFVWTQWRDLEYLSNLPTAFHKPEVDSYGKSPLLCTTRYEILANYNLHPGKVVEMAPLGYDELFSSSSYASVQNSSKLASSGIRIHNRLEGNVHLANKKGLYHNLRRYYGALGRTLSVMPLTFHVLEEGDSSYTAFEAQFYLNQGSGCPNIWIIKPGENSNRGNGITLCNSLEQVHSQVKALCNGKKRTAILQQYIHNPYLVYKRKFDIRCFALVTCYNGVTQAYFYSEGYIRTTAALYSTSNIENKFIHLTNDAVQQKSADYGKFENGNKMNFAEFQKYLDNHYSRKVNFNAEIVPLFKRIVKDTVMATFLKLNPQSRMHSFEILGYDFLLDEDLKPWLLEVNTNPCLELSSPQLGRIIPAMLQNAFRIAIDPVFLEPYGLKRNSFTLVSEPLIENKFQLVFHSLVDGERLRKQLEELGTFGQLTAVDPLLEDYGEENYNDFYESEEDEEDLKEVE